MPLRRSTTKRCARPSRWRSTSNRIVDNFYPAGSIVATQFMPPSIFGYSEGQDWYEYNPEMAKQILTEEGVYDADGVFKTKISYRDVVRGDLPEPGVVAQDIQAQLKEIGVEAEIDAVESRPLPRCCRCRPARRLGYVWLGTDYPNTPTSSIIASAPARQQISAGNLRTCRCTHTCCALADPAHSPAESTTCQRLVRLPRAIGPGGQGSLYNYLPGSVRRRHGIP